MRQKNTMTSALALSLVLWIAGCDVLYDAATSIAYDIENGVGDLGGEGSRHVITHNAKARADASVRTYTVQFDKVGALIVWYKDASGNVVASGSTSYHSRFVDTPATMIVEKPIDEILSIEVQRQHGRAVIMKVY